MLTTLLALFLATIALPPKPDHYINDRAGVLPAERAAALDAKLKSFEQSTSNQIVVYIDHKIPAGTTLEEMGAQAIHEWAIGQKGKDNGAIIFIFTDDRKMRIEVGYGLEGTLTDARSKLITGELMKPRIKQGDYAGAVDAAVNAMMNFANGEGNKGSGRTVAEANAGTHNVNPGLFLLLTFVTLFVIIVIQIARGKIKLSTTSGSGSGTRQDWSSPSSSSSSDSSWSSSSSSDSSSSSSSSDFSGGGGDGGGGGASDSW